MTYRVAVKMAAADYLRLLTRTHDAGVSPSGYMRKCFQNGYIPQAGFVADLGVETLAGCQSFVFLNEREDVERHLIVAAPRHIREAIINDSRYDVNVLLEYGL